MADNTIDNLSIEVTSSADKATRMLERLASGCDRLRGAASRAGGGLRDVAEGAKDAGTEMRTAGQQAGNAEKNTRAFGKAAKDAGNSAKKGAAGIGNFWESLKRIAYYRFIRTILKEIASAFREGITNLYNWSSAINGHFAKSMDRLSTSTLYLKNSLGAMLAPIIERLTPVIEWIIDKIVDVINWINKLFAALSGSQTYTVAKKVATNWQDAGNSAASSASEAADAIKRTILGFDEINKLDNQNNNSGGSFSGNNGSDPSEMFEEKPLDGWAKKLSELINKIMDKLNSLKKWFDDFKNGLKNIWDDFISGAKDFFSDPLDWLKRNVSDPIINGLKKLFGINSPSKEMRDVGYNLVLGLKLGMLDGMGNIDEWVNNNIVKPIKKAFSNKIKLSVYVNVGLKHWGWTTITDWIGTAVTVAVGLKRWDWKTLDNWLGTDQIHYAKIALVKYAWVTMDKFLDLERTHFANIGLLRYGWTSMLVWLGLNLIYSAKIALTKYGWSSMDAFLTTNNVHYAIIGLKKSNWSTIEKFIGTTVWVGIKLYNASGYKSVAQFLGIDKGLTVPLKITGGGGQNYSGGGQTSGGGGQTSGGGAGRGRRANGGVYSNGVWHDIPQFAGGARGIHGTMFLAGEAGPEIVGNIGGRTEVLNKSQIASAIYSAVQAAMAPAASNFAAAAYNMGAGNNGGYDTDAFAVAIQQAVENAMSGERDILRQQSEYLRQINEKDFSPEITTASINRANVRTNRRAGTTIVAVGT